MDVISIGKEVNNITYVVVVYLIVMIYLILVLISFI